MEKITPVDIQHRTFKKALQGYDRSDVDQFLDEIIETLEDEAQQRAALEAEIADLKERVSHFKAMEESLQNTLVLAQRTADEVKASAHKEADLIREQARLAGEREIAGYNDAIAEVRREHHRAIEAFEKARSELRSLLMTHLALLEQRPDGSIVNGEPTSVPAADASSRAESMSSRAESRDRADSKDALSPRAESKDRADSKGPLSSRAESRESDKPKKDDTTRITVY